jgi:hypothetical protein
MSYLLFREKNEWIFFTIKTNQISQEGFSQSFEAIAINNIAAESNIKNNKSNIVNNNWKEKDKSLEVRLI